MKLGDLVRHIGDGDHGIILDTEGNSLFPYLVWWFITEDDDGICWMVGNAMEVISESR
jgi:hypothetical protein